jgi:hypothetical protein
MTKEYNRSEFEQMIKDEIPKSLKTYESFIKYVDENKVVLKMTGEQVVKYINSNPKWKCSSTRDKQVKMMTRLYLWLGKKVDAEYLSGLHSEWMEENTVMKALEKRVVSKVQGYIDKWRASNLKPNDKLILGSLLLRLTPRTDIVNVKMGVSETENHYNPETKQIVYFQTNKNKEPYVEKYDVTEEIQLLIASLNRQNGEYLIKKDGTGERNAWFSTRVIRLSEKIFGEAIGTNAIRKITESNANVGANPKEIIQNARMNGHSASTARTYYVADVVEVTEVLTEVSLDNIFEELDKIFDMTKSTGNIQFMYKKWNVSFTK